MSTITTKFFLAVAVIIFVISTLLVLNDIGQLPGTNNSTTSISQNLGPVTKLVLDTPYKVTIKQGSQSSITLTGNTSRINNTQILEEGDQLTLKSKGGFGGLQWWNNNAEAIITMPSITSITINGGGDVSIGNISTNTTVDLKISGAGNINGSQFKTSNLTVRISGAGNIDISGTSDRCFYSISGAGEILAKDVACNSAETKVSGAGTIRTRVKDTLSASISGAGEIEYYGNPKVDQTVGGIGTITKKGE
jgi:Putative auto-transporter adhesin, head GIN domain